MNTAIGLIPILYGVALIVIGTKIKKAKGEYNESALDKFITAIWFYRLLGGQDESTKPEDRAGEYILAGVLFLFGGAGYLLFFALA
ncbi:MAG: hypothetical protein KJ002_05095 [Candidatus Dadabacteria bacterium]|nr:hypothetical protein [Candidatus Dadabacteria bacterium]